MEFLRLCYDITQSSGRKTMNKRQMKYLFLGAAICLTASCGSDSVEYKYPQKIKGQYEMVTAREAEQMNDTLFNKKYLTFTLNKPQEDAKEIETAQPVETKEVKEIPVSGGKALWGNVLPVLSHYPVAEIHQDSFITTEWFSDPENSSAQLKINAVKTGEVAQITVLRRQKDKNGEWINQKNDAGLADKIKNDIVNRSLNN